MAGKWAQREKLSFDGWSMGLAKQYTMCYIRKVDEVSSNRTAFLVSNSDTLVNNVSRLKIARISFNARLCKAKMKFIYHVKHAISDVILRAGISFLIQVWIQEL